MERLQNAFFLIVPYCGREGNLFASFRFGDRSDFADGGGERVLINRDCSAITE